jgi:nitrogen fixation protein FixH
MSNVERMEKPGFFGRLTGWHVLGFFLLFFGIVFGANGYMAYWAISTFSGIEINDAYQKGRAYNHNLEAMKAQQKLGWTADIEEELVLGAGNKTHLQVRFADAGGAPLTGLRVNGTFWRPDGELAGAHFSRRAPGRKIHTGKTRPDRPLNGYRRPRLGKGATS